jgi:hypothetical protein
MTSKRYLFYASQNYSFAILRPLQKAILTRGDQVLWFLHGNEISYDYLAEDEKNIVSIDEVIDYEPHAVFVPGNVVPKFIPGLKIALFHGFNSGKLNRRGVEDHFNIRGCFDLYCTQGPNTTTKFQQLADKHQHFIVKETGWPTLDYLFQEKNVEPNKIPIVLMCSTFSRNLTCAPILFETIKELSVSGKWRWIIQFHPKMAKDVVQKYKSIENQYLTFVETDNVIPLLQEADVMVCDTSSVLIMFLLQGKPVVTFNNVSPKNYMLDISKPELLEKTIETALSYPKKLMSKVNEFIKDTHPNQDGNSSELVLDQVEKMLSGQELSLKRKPLNIIRSFKMRKNLNYWQFW